MTVPVNGLSSRTTTDNWEEALIVGNGRQGALCYGGPARLLVTVSHERLFLPVRPPLDPPFAGAATLACTPEPVLPGRDYVRFTDFSTGVVTQRWTTDAGPAGMTAFVSRAHDVVALRLHGPGRWALALGPIGGRPPRPMDTTVRRRGDRITLTARFPGPPPGGLTGYTVVCRLHGPDLVLVRTVVGERATLLDDVPPKWTELLRAHAALHRDLYHRVHLDLGPRAPRQTEDLLAAEPGPDTVRRLFDAGRYAVISATGDLPPAPHGVWSGSHDPPRPGRCPVDGNPPGAVAALHPTGCPELMTPLFDLVESAPPTHPRRNAARLARLYYDHWCYTGDRGFLATRALPFMRRAAEVHLNAARRDGPAAPVDVAAVRDLLRNLLAATAELGTADPAEPSWRDLLRSLPRYRIDAAGELGSDLYPLWYEPDPAIVDDPALRAAAVRTVRRRLESRRGDHERAGPGYGLAELGLAAAALGLADEAVETLRLMATRHWRPSLVPADDRGAAFTVDLAGGLPAVVAAMLVRSTQRVLAEPGRARPFERGGAWRTGPRPGGAVPGGAVPGGAGRRTGGPTSAAGGTARPELSSRPPRPGRLDLLPALPAAWPSGSVRGLAARGAVTVRRLSWAAGRYEAVVESCVDQDLLITVAGGEGELLSVVAGRPVRMAGPLRPARRSPAQGR